MNDIEKGRADKEEGQALLEFALVAVFLFFLLFAIMDFARLFFAYATMSNGAREGARYGIVHSDDADAIEERALDMLVLIGDEPHVTVSYPGEDDGSNAGCTAPHRCRIHVLITTTLDVWTPVIPSVELQAQATMHFE